jgi:hypothetical protein
MYVPVGDRSLIPFLVLLFIRTAINVESLYHLTRDCLNEHPLPLGLTVLKFDKPRSGPWRNKTLHFPTKQKNGVVDLIEFLIAYTNPWVPFARESESTELLLYKSTGHGRNEVRSPGTRFGSSLKRFITDNNLPDFNFAQIRPTIATLIYLQTRDIFRVQRLLCHSQVFETIQYVKNEITRRDHDKRFHEGMESIFNLLSNNSSKVGNPTVFIQDIDSVLRDKVSGNELSTQRAQLIKNGGCATGMARCRDPFDSPIPGEQPGRICKQLHMCVFCPNAWIFEEDLPKVIRYRDQLLAERNELSETMWDQLHGQAFREIVEAILPSYPQEVIRRAETKAAEQFGSYFRHKV